MTAEVSGEPGFLFRPASRAQRLRDPNWQQMAGRAPEGSLSVQLGGRIWTWPQADLERAHIATHPIRSSCANKQALRAATGCSAWPHTSSGHGSFPELKRASFCAHWFL